MDAHSHEMKNVSDKIKVEVKDKNGNATDQLSPLKLLNVEFIADKHGKELLQE